MQLLASNGRPTKMRFTLPTDVVTSIDGNRASTSPSVSIASRSSSRASRNRQDRDDSGREVQLRIAPGPHSSRDVEPDCDQRSRFAHRAVRDQRKRLTIALALEAVGLPAPDPVPCGRCVTIWRSPTTCCSTWPRSCGHPGRRLVAGRGRRDRQQPVAELVLHPARAHLDASTRRRTCSPSCCSSLWRSRSAAWCTWPLGDHSWRRRLATEAAVAQGLAEGNRIRTALLAAVGHDLRTPLASVKASVSSLRQTDVTWSAEDQRELLATIEEGADRLNALISNLLDMSRIQTGAVQLFVRPTSLEEVAPLVVQVDGRRWVARVRHARRPAAVRCRSRVARTRAGQSGGERPALLTRRPAADAARAVQNGNAHGTCRSRSSTTALACRTTSGSASSRRSSSSATRAATNGVGSRPRGHQGLRRGDGRQASRAGHGRRRADDADRAAPSAPRLRRRVTSVLVIDDEAAILRALRINLVGPRLQRHDGVRWSVRSGRHGT